MKSTVIIRGNACGNETVTSITFRKTSFLTEDNRKPIEECVRAFNDLPYGTAFKYLVFLTCWSKERIPEYVWDEIHLDSTLIKDEAWSTFVNELCYQYKNTHSSFMTEFHIPSKCTAAYTALATATSEVAAYLFYKKALYFMEVNSEDHISWTCNRLDWHAKDEDVNQKKRFSALKQLSLNNQEANYFLPHCEKVLALLDAMKAPMKNDNQADSELPFSIGPSTATAVPAQDEIAETPVSEDSTAVEHAPETEVSSSLELSLENILAHEKDFHEFVFNDSADSLFRLFTAGFDLVALRTKKIKISLVLRAHNELTKAVEALAK